jgi:DNA primase
MSFGRLVNGVVKLSPQRWENGELVVVEGVVKGLAAIHCAVPGVVCATLGKDTMRGLPHLSRVTRLTIVPDNDDAGDEAAAELSHRYRWRGTAVRIVAPPWGTDLDAFLRGEA